MWLIEAIKKEAEKEVEELKLHLKNAEEENDKFRCSFFRNALLIVGNCKIFTALLRIFRRPVVRHLEIQNEALLKHKPELLNRYWDAKNSGDRREEGRALFEILGYRFNEQPKLSRLLIWLFLAKGDQDVFRTRSINFICNSSNSNIGDCKILVAVCSIHFSQSI